MPCRYFKRGLCFHVHQFQIVPFQKIHFLGCQNLNKCRALIFEANFLETGYDGFRLLPQISKLLILQ